MDALRLIIAFGPVAIYILVLGGINFSRRALLATGGRDAAVLALAVLGMLIVGPFKLFLPRPALLLYGPYAWLMLLGLYALCVTMCVLMSRPRLVIYNISLDKFRPVLAETVAQLDNEARWVGDSVLLPG
ncbi:MAG: hypothetical protein ACWGMZ_10715, partial [Thermoguttaceae bacterium]